MSKPRSSTEVHTNPDPITHVHGAHPVGTGVGAALGGAAGIAGAMATGAAVGTVAGPIGTVTGAAIGAVVGGMAGRFVAEDVNPTVEETYWRDNYASRPYISIKSYETYGPAYRYGWESYTKHVGKQFEDVESELERGWDRAKGKSRLVWRHARSAARDAWERIEARNEQSKRD
jgi:phage tail tape-measure protein